MITAEYLRSILVYDPITGLWMWLRTMGSRAKAGDPAGSFNDKGYRVIKIHRVLYKASQLAVLFMTGHLPKLGIEVDHKNNIKSDDRWENLREATHSQNMVNRDYPERDLPRGVYRANSKKDRFVAVINRDHIGTYDTPEEASSAFRQAAIERYGEQWLTQD